ncbi:hypothetical protein FGKAn22_16730 [Ferrigenium kumadai]|uniref:Filamentous haemagglutinin FhaB/tRNA nuclease CdiA-like TPS domain-containing protein n=1 Tax=Ferrigenium kumadai TaxID=1682490 RepID=A0AAN1W028_9PROT|nr:filamentous hemagglutinin N-terminal domain-containing protein [Ferrigenium kumadai]BBI99980.1 hypothetical protein FGKAn22_16730 [Ferrigenium kumadai]
MQRHASMNHIYRLVWSHVLNSWVAVAETARGCGKRTCRRLVAAAFVLCAGQALAAPTGGLVTAGSGTITRSGTTTTIKQTSPNLSLSWQSFDTAPTETVNFVQPSAAAVAVNRIYDTNGTQFLGHLNANGQVYLINPNGILFGAGSQVNVGGLVASTLDINDASLNSATRSFSGHGTGSIVNRGTINGGYVAFIGNTVSNQGTIVANGGTAALGAGDAVTLTFAGNSLVKLQVDRSTLDNLAENGGLIRADGGMVLMSAGAKNALLASAVNNTGVIEARTVQNVNGTIILMGGMAAGTVNVGGTLDASAPAAANPGAINRAPTGGFIETSAAHVKIANGAVVTTKSENGLSGTWLIDPVDFTIAASGGDMTGATLSTNLAGGNVIIQSTSGAAGTAGDVNVNDSVTWSANTLTLNAQRNININAAMNGSGTAGLALEYGQGAVNAGNTAAYNVNAPVNLASTGSFSTKLGSDGATTPYTIITTLGTRSSNAGTDLQGVAGNLAGHYVLGANIDATETVGWEGGAGFMPAGNIFFNFTGVFDGLGHTIDGLTINRPGDYAGLFGAVSGTLRNVGLTNVNINGGSIAGTLTATLNGGSIANSYATGTVAGANYQTTVGGLVGEMSGGTITNSYATADVHGTAASAVYGGGLVGGYRGARSRTAMPRAQSAPLEVYGSSAVWWGRYRGARSPTATGTPSHPARRPLRPAPASPPRRCSPWPASAAGASPTAAAVRRFGASTREPPIRCCVPS